MTDWSDAEDREQAALDAARLHEWATERRIDARDAEIARLRAEVERLSRMLADLVTEHNAYVFTHPSTDECEVDRLRDGIAEIAAGWDRLARGDQHPLLRGTVASCAGQLIDLLHPEEDA